MVHDVSDRYPIYLTVCKARLKKDITQRFFRAGSPTFLKLRATFWYKFMRRATSLIHTVEKTFGGTELEDGVK